MWLKREGPPHVATEDAHHHGTRQGVCTALLPFRKGISACPFRSCCFPFSVCFSSSILATIFQANLGNSGLVSGVFEAPAWSRTRILELVEVAP